MLNVRLATQSDRSEALRLVRGLLTELGGNPAPADALFGAFDELVSGRDAGFIVIAGEDGAAKAVCTASIVCAIRTAGRYVILQEMYVEPESRNSGVGRAVIDFALEHAVASGCQVVELGTPRNGQRQIEFYERAGFVNVGARLRWATPTTGFVSAAKWLIKNGKAQERKTAIFISLARGLYERSRNVGQNGAGGA